MKNKGFTLIEVMVALAIIAIALAALIKASGNYTRSAGYLKSKTLAHYVAMNEVSRLQIERAWPDLGTKKDDSEMAGVEWFWTREVNKKMDESDTIRGIKFSVFQDDARAHSLAQIQILIANPAISLPSASNSANNSNANGAANNAP